MEKTFLAITPLALAAALSPTSLLFVTAILGGKGNTRKNALLFVIGGACFLVVLGLAVMLIFKHTVIPSDHHKKLSAWIDIILGVLIFIGVWWSMMFKHKKKAAKKESRKHPYIFMGFLAMMINTSTNIPFIAASKTIADSRLAFQYIVILFSSLVIITMAMIAFPVIFSYVAPERSEVVLGNFRTFMQRYGPQMVRAIFLLVGVYLIGKGVLSLVS